MILTKMELRVSEVRHDTIALFRHLSIGYYGESASPWNDLTTILDWRSCPLEQCNVPLLLTGAVAVAR